MPRTHARPRPKSSRGLSRPSQARIEVPPEALAALCLRHHVRQLALFGSVLSDRFGPESDVDVLVDFEPGHVPGLRFIRLEQELSRLFNGRKVDLVTRKFLHPRIRETVLREAEVQ